MRGKKEYHPAFGIQRSERQRQWRFRQAIRAGAFYRGRLLRRGMRLPLSIRDGRERSDAILFSEFSAGSLPVSRADY